MIPNDIPRAKDPTKFTIKVEKGKLELKLLCIMRYKIYLKTDPIPPPRKTKARDGLIQFGKFYTTEVIF